MSSNEPTNPSNLPNLKNEGKPLLKNAKAEAEEIRREKRLIFGLINSLLECCIPRLFKKRKYDDPVQEINIGQSKGDASEQLLAKVDNTVQSQEANVEAKQAANDAEEGSTE